MKATAVCPHCGERKELASLDKGIVPLVCQKCGQIMIIGTPEHEHYSAAPHGRAIPEGEAPAPQTRAGAEIALPASIGRASAESAPPIFPPAPQQFHAAPPQFHAPPPQYYYPMYYPYGARPQRWRANTCRLASILLNLSGILGLVFWCSFFLYDYLSGNARLVPDSSGGMVGFGFSMLMLLSSIYTLVWGYCARQKNYEIALTASIFGLVSFGYLVGSIFSLAAIAIIMDHPEDFAHEGQVDEKR